MEFLKNSKEIETQYRTIKTAIPHPDDLLVLEDIACLESSLFAKESPVVWDRAEGATIYDRWGNRWIDLSSSIFVTNAGHANSRIKTRILETVSRDLFHAYCYPTKERADFLKKLIEVTPFYLEQASLVTTGTEASERALKLARIYGMQFSARKKVIVGSIGNFHGKTIGAMMAATSQKAREWIGNQDPDMRHIPFPFPWILEKNGKSGEQIFHEHMTALFEKGVKSSEIAAFIIESYQGWGAVFYPKNYVQTMSYWAKEHGALVIVDEIQAGFGRTGVFFAYEHYDIQPDLVCCGKGISGGMPLSAVLGRKELIELDPTLTSTHGGHPVSCAGALGNLEALVDDGLIDYGAKLGNKLSGWLKEWKRLYPNRISRILGRGMVWAIFICKPSSREQDVEFTNRLVDRLLQKGVFSVRTGCGTIKLGPPLCIEEKALKEAIDLHIETMGELIEEEKCCK